MNYSTNNSKNSNTKTRVAYVLSHSFSGSTLLTLMMSTHPEMAGVGELDGINDRILADERASLDYLCSCGAKVLECTFWNELGKRIERRGLVFRHPALGTRFDLTQFRSINKLIRASLRNNTLEAIREWLLHHIPPFSHRFDQVAATNIAAIEEVLAMTGAQVFIDESKNPVRYARLAALPELDVRPIYLTRDGRAVALSVRKRGNKSWAPAIRSWVQINHSILRILNNTKRPWLHIRYEDLCDNPTATLQSIHQFLGITPKSWPPTDSPRPHHILGNDMRVRYNGTIQRDERWLNELNDQELSQFKHIGEPMNTLLGYR